MADIMCQELQKKNLFLPHRQVFFFTIVSCPQVRSPAEQNYPFKWRSAVDTILSRCISESLSSWHARVEAKRVIILATVRNIAFGLCSFPPDSSLLYMYNIYFLLFYSSTLDKSCYFLYTCYIIKIKFKHSRAISFLPR